VVGDIGVQNQYMKETIQAIVDKNPDLIIHLGDIYLVEGPRSARNSPLFCRRLLETCPCSLPGNHEYIANGQGYFKMLKGKFDRPSYEGKNQTHSFFRLVGKDLEIVGLDSGIMCDNFAYQLDAHLFGEVRSEEDHWTLLDDSQNPLVAAFAEGT